MTTMLYWVRTPWTMNAKYMYVDVSVLFLNCITLFLL